MTLFWILTGAAALILTVALVLALLRGRRATGPAEAYDLQVYRDQLTEIEADAARGKIPPEEAERLRLEISRRLLAADAKVRGASAGSDQPRGLGYAMAALIPLVVIGGGFGLYTQIGAPGYGDVPLQLRLLRAEEALKQRMPQQEIEARIPPQPASDSSPEYIDLVVKLRAAVAERPDDLQGNRLLARSEAALGNFQAAYKAQQQIIRLKGADATAQDYTDMADMMILAAGGYVSPEAQAALEQALALDPSNGVARYYGGLMMAQVGRPDVGFRMWNQLLRDSTPQDPWVEPIVAQIEDLAYLAGQQNFEMPMMAGGRGPTQADVAAAADMTPEQRMDMIGGMVAQLSDRLATEGGPVEDWAKLINALAVLGRKDEADAIWTEAQTVFAASDTALQFLKETAVSAGLDN